MNELLDLLQTRGLVEGIIGEAALKNRKEPMLVYAGFDPTAESLHIGNLVILNVLRWFQKYGHRPVVLMGGATGKIGDPSGKSSERVLLDEATVAHNRRGIEKQIKRLLDSQDLNTAPIVLDNEAWLGQFSLIDFLRKVGRHARIGTMLARESVRARMEDGDGLSFTEFSYQLLQAEDFRYLHEKHGVEMQIGGSDQWGNLVAGCDLVRRTRGASVFGLTVPLLTKSDGKKFGKSEAGAIWLSAEKLSPYDFYQSFLRLSDIDAKKFLPLLSFLDMKEVCRYQKELVPESGAPNVVQKRLAEEVTRLIHGETGLAAALKETAILAPGKIESGSLMHCSWDDIRDFVEIEQAALLGSTFIELFLQVGLVASKGEARRSIENKGLYCNDAVILDGATKIAPDHIRHSEQLGDFLCLAMGKKKKKFVRVK